ncbi:hypothetical protein CC85DRAFT_287847 [Cutaneotrichosporon oleaginosum]|uniref:Uncharacterized protein n=1 Tax=Cutaneotrichosporon oleaginosum TaxID=879819 RepID=A0A0J1AXL5_9TREE|nr:uncharacterized protein CC85DRAFT_287847 [Cutaneotrichosporon oleaginosum]KLT40059.1 hypothetical protein CC85DRAFT_287847 [Cutaneotrichosporon oleaginosum]TXT10394.1 hypothetical protein COLE_04328 [Cutaneotrichosporon oleaginosum]
MPAVTRRHTPTSSPTQVDNTLPSDDLTAAAPTYDPSIHASYPLSSIYPPDKIGFPSCPPRALGSYRDACDSDTETDSGASDAEIDADLNAVPQSLLAQIRGRRMDEGSGVPDVNAWVRAWRSTGKAKTQAALGIGRRTRSRTASGLSRVVSPTESIYAMTQRMQTLKATLLRSEDEIVVCDSDLEASDSPPVSVPSSPPPSIPEPSIPEVSSPLPSSPIPSTPEPSSPEPSDVDTPVPRTRQAPLSSLALIRSKVNKHRAEAVRSIAESSSRRAVHDAWRAHESDVQPAMAMIEAYIDRQGLRLVPKTPEAPSIALPLSDSPDSTFDANAIEAGLSPPSPTPRSSFPRISHVLTSSEPTPDPDQATSPLAVDYVEDAILAVPPDDGSSSEDGDDEFSSSEEDVGAEGWSDDEQWSDEEPTATSQVEQIRRQAPRQWERPMTTARERYAHDHPRANHAVATRRTRLHQIGTNAGRSSTPRPASPRPGASAAPSFDWRRPRLHVVRRPVVLRPPRRTVFTGKQASNRTVNTAKDLKAILKSKSSKLSDRVRRAMIQRYNQKPENKPRPRGVVVASRPTTPTYERQRSRSPEPYILNTEHLSADVVMHDSEAVQAAAIAKPSQLAGHKRRSMPGDGSTVRDAQRDILRAEEIGWNQRFHRDRDALRRAKCDPAFVEERRRFNKLQHYALKAPSLAAQAASNANASVVNALEDDDVEMAEPEVVAPVEEADVAAAVVEAAVAEAVVDDLVDPVTSSAFVTFDPSVLPSFIRDGTPLATCPEVVEDIVLLQPPAPVEVMEEMSQPPASEPRDTFAPRARRLRAHEHFMALAASSAQPARSLLRGNRSADTAPMAETAGPSFRVSPTIVSARLGSPTNVSVTMESSSNVSVIMDSPTGASTPLEPADALAPAAAAAMRSPPPRYEFDFYPIVRTPVRQRPAARPAPRPRSASDPPDYTGPYRDMSPPPPPPYNSITDCATIIAARFEDAPTPRTHSHSLSEVEEGGEDERYAPGMWPAQRRSPSPDDGGGQGNILGRVLGFFR